VSEPIPLHAKVNDVDPIVQLEAQLNNLCHALEGLDEGVRLAAKVLAEQDVRIRKLEIAERKRERKLVIATDMADATRQ
jgi:hypothetical protein